MNLLRNRILGFLCIGLTSAAATVVLPACDDGGDGGVLGDIAAQCGLTCGSTIASGNASISGVASVDAFFSSVLTIDAAALELEASVKAELLGMGKDLGLTLDANADLATIAGQVKAELDLQISTYMEGSIQLNAEPPRCEVQADLVAKASAECDASVDPGTFEVDCKGSCEADVSAGVMCDASATVMCEVTAPSVECSGMCEGTCQLEVAAECSGTCQGSCMGSCSACIGGNCETDDSGAITNCAGACMGSCQGSCELGASASCSGKCEGKCTYDPGGAACSADAQVHCEAQADASIKCSGKCDGDFEAPMVKAECKAAVEAKASASVDCKPGHVSLKYQFKAGADAAGQARFKAFLRGLDGRLSGLFALQAKLEGIGKAGARIGVTGKGALEGAFNASLSADATLKTQKGIVCAIGQLDGALTMAASATTKVTASASAVANIGTSFASMRE